ncbi:MAG: putative zinc-finger [Planctomycetota bacterium]
MNQHLPEPSRPIACSELKAALSAYLDDELTRDERLRTDAHLVDCGKCRDLVERAEHLDDSLRAQFALDLERAAAEISADSVDTAAMQASVLAAIGAPAPRRWLPRLAIAAGLAGAAVAVIAFWNTGSRNDALAPLGPGQFASTNDAGRSGTEPVAPPRREAIALAALDADERQLLYSTGVILTNLKREGFERSPSAVQLREVARYDELVDRLDVVLGKVAPEDRATVAFARETIEHFLESASDPNRLDEIRRDLERTDIDARLTTLSDA